MIQLAWPWMALLAPMPWLLYRFRRAAEPGGSVLFLPMAAHVRTAPTRSTVTSRGALSLFSLLWLLLVLASMRPQWLGEPVAVPTTGRRLLLATDVSGSMATEDMANGESRLQVVQQVAGRFIDHRHGDQVGLILFGTRPYIQSPLSTDLATVHRFLDEAVVGVAGPETAIGDAIGLAIKRLAEQGAVARSMVAPHTRRSGGAVTAKIPFRAHAEAKRGLAMNLARPVITGLLVGTLSLPALGAARAWLDSDEVGPGDSVQLTLEEDSQTNSQPDLTPLRRDFDVLGTSTSRKFQIVNGHTSSATQLIINESCSLEKRKCRREFEFCPSERSCSPGHRLGGMRIRGNGCGARDPKCCLGRA